jgi:predicted ATPase/DNA-binding CsgD family transcriptional regulator
MAMTETGFGDLLRRYRTAAGLTQEELAERAGLSTRGISDLERGARGLPRKDTLQLCLHALDLSPEDRATLVSAATRPPAAPPARQRTDGRPALPVPLTPLIGREQEIAAVSTLLRDPAVRLVTLTGPGGTGKTRLALAVAEHGAADFPDGVVFVPLASLGDPAFVPSVIAQRLGVREATGQTLLDRLVSSLADKHRLLILDNFEHLLPAASLLADLLGAGPGLQVLVTSRAALHLTGEHIFPVPPLRLPDPGRLPLLETLAQNEAVRLFVARAQALNPGFALTVENAPAVAEIVHRLDGLPLAVELAAARVPVLSPAALLARLDRRLPLLTGGAQDLPDRQKTLRDTIAWSYDLLSAGEQALFRRLAAFEGGSTLEAAEAVCGEAGLDVLEAMRALVDQSLLQRMELPGAPPRFGMLETVREYASERLVASGEAESLRVRHARYFTGLAEQAEPTGFAAAESTAAEQLEAELPNMRAALAWAIEQGATELLLRLTVALWQFWVQISPGEGYLWLERAVATTAQAPRGLLGKRARLLATTAQLAWWRGDLARMVQLLDESIAMAREAGDARATALALQGYGSVAAVHGELERAAALSVEALTHWRALADPVGTAETLYHLGYIAALQGDQDAAERWFSEALNEARAIGSRLWIAGALEALGTCARERGDLCRAARLFGESLALLGERGNPLLVGNCLKSLGAVAGVAGDPRQAARLLGAAEALRERHGLAVYPAELPRLERASAPARARLSATSFAAAWAAGRALPVEQAVVEALQVADDVTAAWAPDPSASHGLSPRELEVLRLLAEGHPDRQIAETLSISPKTVGRHISNILVKLDVATRTAAATHAVRHNLV